MKRLLLIAALGALLLGGWSWDGARATTISGWILNTGGASCTSANACRFLDCRSAGCIDVGTGVLRSSAAYCSVPFFYYYAQDGKVYRCDQRPFSFNAYYLGRTGDEVRHSFCAAQPVIGGWAISTAVSFILSGRYPWIHTGQLRAGTNGVRPAKKCY